MVAVKPPPLVVHIIHRLDTGGMENGLINLINAMPAGFCRHAIVCLTDYSEFARRLQRDDVQVFALHKKSGRDIGLHYRVWRLLRTLRPAIVHTRNLAALEMSVIAMLAGVRWRVHGEHGRDIYDLHGRNRKYRLLRRLCSYFVRHFITVSKDLQSWLVDDLHIPARKVTQIYNGVDNLRFQAMERSPCRQLYRSGFQAENLFVIGTVGRLQPVKNQRYLLQAFAELLTLQPALRERLRLVLVGDGGDRPMLEQLAGEQPLSGLVWFAGDRSDVPQLLAGMDLFVLPSLAEGISNTILEAMSAGLPVVATGVGGNPELVQPSVTGALVPVDEPATLAAVMLDYIKEPQRVTQQGSRARARIEQHFSMASMVAAYQAIYQRCLT